MNETLGGESLSKNTFFIVRETQAELCSVLMRDGSQFWNLHWDERAHNNKIINTREFDSGNNIYIISEHIHEQWSALKLHFNGKVYMNRISLFSLTIFRHSTRSKLQFPEKRVQLPDRVEIFHCDSKAYLARLFLHVSRPSQIEFMFSHFLFSVEALATTERGWKSVRSSRVLGE